jgi:hypothetical protein
MTQTGKAVRFMGILMALAILTGSCAKEKIESGLDSREDYSLTATGGTDVSGTIAFKKEAGGTRVTINLSGTTSATTYAATLYQYTITESGPVALSLGPISGSSGQLDTLIRQLDNGVIISFTEMVNYDGHISIREMGEVGRNVARADIGGNVLTGKSRSYTLDTVNSSGIKGTLMLQERKNATTLATLTLNGINASDDVLHVYPAIIYNGQVGDTTNSEAIVLGNVDTVTGKLVKNIRVKDKVDIKFADLVSFNGYIKVQQQSVSGSIVVAQGNIGQHAP